MSVCHGGGRRRGRADGDGGAGGSTWWYFPSLKMRHRPGLRRGGKSMMRHRCAVRRNAMTQRFASCFFLRRKSMTTQTVCVIGASLEKPNDANSGGPFRRVHMEPLPVPALHRVVVVRDVQ